MHGPRGPQNETWILLNGQLGTYTTQKFGTALPFPLPPSCENAIENGRSVLFTKMAFVHSALDAVLLFCFQRVVPNTSNHPLPRSTFFPRTNLHCRLDKLSVIFNIFSIFPFLLFHHTWFL